MTPTPEVQKRLRRYLLGQLSDDAREELEQELLTSDETFQELLVLEDELVDEYLGGRISADDRHHFAEYFLISPERQEKLRFARALAKAAKARHAQTKRVSLPQIWSKSPFLYRATAVTAIVVILAGIVWIASRRQRAPATFATLRLAVSESTRSGDTTQAPNLSFPLPQDAVRIVMELPDQSSPAAHYRVGVETDFGEKRFTEPVAQDSNSVTVVIPAGDLRRGQYALSLYAVSNNGEGRRLPGSYRFNVQ